MRNVDSINLINTIHEILNVPLNQTMEVENKITILSKMVLIILEDFLY